MFICIEALNNPKDLSVNMCRTLHPQQPNMHFKICSPGTFTNRTFFWVVKQSLANWKKLKYFPSLLCSLSTQSNKNNFAIRMKFFELCLLNIFVLSLSLSHCYCFSFAFGLLPQLSIWFLFFWSHQLQTPFCVATRVVFIEHKSETPQFKILQWILFIN